MLTKRFEPDYTRATRLTSGSMSTKGHPKGLLGARQDYRKEWYRGPPPNEMRKKYNDDLHAYWKDFQPSEEDRNFTEEHFLSHGMEYFKNLEGKLIQQMRIKLYRTKGQKLLEAFSAALNEKEKITDLSTKADFVFVAIDFEGSPGQYSGIKEFGVAKMDTRNMLCTSDHFTDSIQTSNFAFSRYSSSRKFRFGETFKKDKSQIQNTVCEALNINDQESNSNESECTRKILLVVHSLDAELRILDALGLPIEAFSHIVGVIDTASLPDAEPHLRDLNLKRLLNWFKIPWRMESLHCGGNDANYTLRALFAFLHERDCACRPVSSCSKTGRRSNATLVEATDYRELLSDRACICNLDKLAKAPVPDPLCWSRVPDDSWDCHLDGLSSLVLV